MATQRNLDSKAVSGIMNKRGLVTRNQVGKRVALIIQGNGNIIDVKNAKGELVMSAQHADVVLQKLIFNCKANSQVAMQAAPNKKLLKDAIAAEKAGDAEGASDLFNKYLNKVQFSASILNPSTSALAARIMSGSEVVGTIEEVVTDNGSLLTFEPGTLSIQEPERVSKTTFSIEDALSDGDEDDTVTEEEPTAAPAGEKPAAKAARIKADLARGVNPAKIAGYKVTAEV